MFTLMKEPDGGELVSDAILLTLGREPPPHGCDERWSFFEFRAKLCKTNQVILAIPVSKYRSMIHCTRR